MSSLRSETSKVNVKVGDFWGVTSKVTDRSNFAKNDKSQQMTHHSLFTAMGLLHCSSIGLISSLPLVSIFQHELYVLCGRKIFNSVAR